MEESPSPARTGPFSWDLLLEVLASVLLIATVWTVDYLPTHDGPHHIYLAHVGNHFGHGPTAYPFYYELGRPLTALGFDLLFGPLEMVLPWRDALRVALSIIVLVYAWGARTLVVSVHPGRRPLGLLGFALALPWALYMGFFSFVLATGIGFFVLALALRPSPWSPARTAGIGGLLLVQAVSHVFCAAISGFVLLLVVALNCAPNRLRRFVTLGVVGVLPVAIALYTYGLLSEPLHAESLAALGSFWPSVPKRVAYLVYLHVPGPVWKAWPILIVALAGTVDAARRTRRGEQRQPEMPLVLAAAALLLAAVLLPLHVRGRWEFLSPRFLPVAVVLGISFLGIERLPLSWVKGVRAVVAVFVLSSVVWSGWLHRSLRGACDEALSGLDDTRLRGGPRLPIVLDTKCGAHSFLLANHVYYVEPLLNLGALYAVQQGGVVPYVFALQPRLHPFVVTPETVFAFPRVPNRRDLWVRAMSKPSGSERLAILQELASYGPPFEDVILWGSPSDADRFVEWGYRPEVRRGGLLLGHFDGCPTTLQILIPEGRGGSLEVAWGWGLLDRMEWTRTLAVDPSSEKQVVEVPLLGAPCGDMRVRAALGQVLEPATAPLQCDGARSDGVLRIVATPHCGVSECSLR